MSASALLAIAPTRDMRSPKSGMPMAMPAMCVGVWVCGCVGGYGCGCGYGCGYGEGGHVHVCVCVNVGDRF